MLKIVVLLLSLWLTPALAETEHRFVIKSGDTISKYFTKLGLSQQLLKQLVMASKENRQLDHLKIGNTLVIRTNEAGKLSSISYQINRHKTITVKVGEAERKTTNWSDTGLDLTQITIKRSLYADAKSKLSQALIGDITEALAWDLDFASELHKGDRFYVAHQHDKLAAVVFIGKLKRIEAFEWQGKYYDRHGNSLSKSFLRAPLKYKRISSGYQLKRFHPVLKQYRPHRAIDYAANYGTPVRATADGVISFKGWKGPLGKAIMIKHGNEYVTAYAHLSKYARGMRKSKRVKKGQVIGYVGSTGRSTGPHLHYELRHKGKYKNPLTHPLPKAYSVPNTERWEFRDKVNTILSRLN